MRAGVPIAQISKRLDRHSVLPSPKLPNVTIYATRMGPTELTVSLSSSDAIHSSCEDADSLPSVYQPGLVYGAP